MSSNPNLILFQVVLARQIAEALRCEHFGIGWAPSSSLGLLFFFFPSANTRVWVLVELLLLNQDCRLDLLLVLLAIDIMLTILGS